MAIYGEPAPAPALPFRSVRARLRAYRARDPAKVAIHDLEQGTRITYGELDDLANRVASRLRARGLGPGDRVALLSEENLEKLVLWLGIWRLGAVVCPFDVEMNAAHLGQLLANVDPALVLRHEGLDRLGLGAPPAVDTLVFSTLGPRPGARADELFARLAEPAAAPAVDTENGPDDVAAIFCTSGTTARPKCVVFTHRAYWLNGLDTLDMLGLTAADRTLEYRSFGWNSAQILSLMPMLLTGLTLHIAKRFSHHRFFEWIRAHAITFAAGVPTVVNMLLEEPLEPAARAAPSLRLMTCSTAPLGPEQWRRFEEMYGVTLLQLYGMSEAGWICGNRHDRKKMGTVGPPARHQQFLIVDPEGRPCPVGVEGEVTVGGPQISAGAISPDGRYEDLAGARLRTGDLAVMDAEGFVTVTGRTKDLVIRGGVNISPLEIDHVLVQHPDVAEAAAIGVPDAVYGEEIVAYVVAGAGASLSYDALYRHCAEHLPAFKMPKAFRVVDSLPKSDRGKVRRDDLKRRWAEEGG